MKEHAMRRLFTLTAALLAVLPGTAGAAAPCLTPDEFASLAQFSLPSVVDGARARCASNLSADAFLRKDGEALARRWAQAGDKSWPQAKAAFLKLSDTGNADANTLMLAMPEDSLREMVSGFVEGIVASQLPLDRCGLADRIIGVLAPLPSRNTAELIAMLVELGTEKKGGKLGSFSICPA